MESILIHCFLLGIDDRLFAQELIQRRDGILGAMLEGGGLLRQIGRTFTSSEFDRGRQPRQGHGADLTGTALQ